ncbi:peptidylprolyl isomerase [Microbulbifer echini]|uniref:peptidylprolyl isomerase n=1 Tax=Microbulbifer echini TaxID=1529067 RepID=A0ABV4NMR0_9GAMM|nr:peptidylprolyl isomerase [uncultured Microbulbifer sp.]
MYWSFSRLGRDPLIHFLIIALLLFVGAELIEKKGDGSDQEHIILLNKDNLIEYIQYQKKTFNPIYSRRYWQNLTDIERANLIADYIQEEILYREAINLGLQENDQIIRRRLIQKLEYVTEGFFEDININEDNLEAYFRLHQEKYRIDASITFTHVFFDHKIHSKIKLKETAKRTLDHLLKKSEAFEKSSLYGDRFVFHRNYVERTPQLVASHFGDAFAKWAFQLPLNTWSGPFESPYGLHLVLAISNKSSRLPNFREAAPLVRADYRHEKMEEKKRRKIEELMNRYQVVWSSPMPNVSTEVTYAK